MPDSDFTEHFPVTFVSRGDNVQLLATNSKQVATAAAGLSLGQSALPKHHRL